MLNCCGAKKNIRTRELGFTLNLGLKLFWQDNEEYCKYFFSLFCLFAFFHLFYFRYAGRPIAASTATGTKVQHLKELSDFLDEATTLSK